MDRSYLKALHVIFFRQYGQALRIWFFFFFLEDSTQNFPEEENGYEVTVPSQIEAQKRVTIRI